MIDFFTNFHFIRPWVLFLLIIPIIFLLKKTKIAYTSSAWENVCEQNLLNFLIIRDSRFSFISLKKIIYFGIFSAIISAAGPSWKKNEIPSFTIENPNMIVLSLAQDMQLQDISPSRLERAKFLISDLTDAFPKGQFGFEVYSQEPYIISPISDDILLLKNLLPQIVPNIVPDQGDRLDRAINLAIERFNSAGFSHGNIIIFASDVGQRFDLAIEAVQKAAKLNYHIYIVDTSFAKNEKLKILTDKASGFYTSIQNADLQALINNINDVNDAQVKLSQNMRSQFIDFGYYLLIIPLICTLFLFRRGVLFAFLLCIFNINYAYAGFFLNENQEALKFFNDANYSKASQLFQNSTWKGISLYKENKLEEALKEFEKGKSDIDFYNKALIEAKLCKYEDAYKDFQNALKINPKNDDASYNLSLLNDLFEKAKSDPSLLSCDDNQKQNSSSQNNNSDNEDNNQQSEKSSSSQNNESQNNNNNSQSAEQRQNDKSQENSSDEKQQKEQSQQQSDNNSENQKNSENTQEASNNNKSSENSQKNNQDSNNSSQEKENSPEQTNQDQGAPQKTHNEEGDENEGFENQDQEQTVNLVNAKKGSPEENYDEKALIMQRRYRDIPEDTGGLLREFIKKEYSKGRYKNEGI